MGHIDHNRQLIHPCHSRSSEFGKAVARCSVQGSPYLIIEKVLKAHQAVALIIQPIDRLDIAFEGMRSFDAQNPNDETRRCGQALHFCDQRERDRVEIIAGFGQGALKATPTLPTQIGIVQIVSGQSNNELVITLCKPMKLLRLIGRACLKAAPRRHGPPLAKRQGRDVVSSVGFVLVVILAGW